MCLIIKLRRALRGDSKLLEPGVQSQSPVVVDFRDQMALEQQGLVNDNARL